ncbi:uncharacterized protein A1O5_00211 [Cladophialophora psammophila CBS 110553]|uniref:NAD(P)-binding protein n=1 Tax=Cladophialophora psammophila CBS 110553 TaxID=1182543 RepID=W9XZK5_9EURO|nr:uncharacterized protein A1O5_00211 [Cladophialophora psammophila CBS 110553]EXJ75704.1 hypothetical protein A1O5_00211 [Cladophialophora psammophila CBS 110553]
MPPTGLAILLGAGPTTGSGIARVLARPSQGNLAVALLSRSGDVQLAERLSRESSGGVLKAFKTDTSVQSLNDAFDEIKQWSESLGKEMKLKLAVWSIKHSHKTPFEDESAQRFGDSLQIYVTGAMVFSQLCLKWMLAQYPADVEKSSESGGEDMMIKKGTLIFTGTLGALRTNPGYAAYGAGRAGVRMLAQSLAREYSPKGVHVVHAIANGGIVDVDSSAGSGGEAGSEAKEKTAKVMLGEKIRAESVGRLYLDCMRQSCDLWVHELDMRPAREKF